MTRASCRLCLSGFSLVSTALVPRRSAFAFLTERSTFVLVVAILELLSSWKNILPRNWKRALEAILTQVAETNHPSRDQVPPRNCSNKSTRWISSCLQISNLFRKEVNLLRRTEHEVNIYFIQELYQNKFNYSIQKNKWKIKIL